MYKNFVKYAQRVLRACAGYRGAIDGVPGNQSLAAAGRFAGPGVSAQMDARGHIIAGAQLALRAAGFDPGPIDGRWGSATDAAYLQWRAAAQGVAFLDRDGESDFGRQSEIEQMFGPAGGPDCTAGKVLVPWGMVLAWDTSQKITTISCHIKVAASAQRAFDRIDAAYNAVQIRDLGLNYYGGCYNYRKKRGGSTLSTHAWGVAKDFDPARNRLNWGADRARLAQRDATPFWQAWEAEGWLSLGRARDYDWMHVQAPAL